MKNIFILASILVCFQISAQRKPKIKGNRKVVDVQQDLPPFNAIELKDDLEIRIRNSAREGYEITADDNLIDVLKFEVENGTLVISAFYNITRSKKLDITVNYEHIDSITLFDGRVITDGAIATDEIYINTYGRSKLEIEANAPSINLNMEENSSGEFKFNGEVMNFVLKDKTDARIYAAGDLNTLKLYANAKVQLEGTTQELRANLIESSDLEGERLEAEAVFLTLQDRSSAHINALSTLELTSRGSSKTYLFGAAEIKILEFLDTSELHKEK
ncbi:GIN domain-containing protein [Pareuzebyella sediminis]|uniref:GIN domain-containing protein n=1 Tax=Pareuzebyella sediminis TaxID=2607998 RepID=UPI0011F057CD|nr:DUF2807 domain-containing protein [Pareuzebyella sediminis]